MYEFFRRTWQVLTNHSAQGETRTPMPVTALPPQGSTSTNFATCAWVLYYSLFASTPVSTASSTGAASTVVTPEPARITRERRSWRRASRATFSRMK